VHGEPGTTRDVLDAVVSWDGIPVRLVDTAGLREGVEPVERAGIERARREMDKADVVLWVVDGSEDPTDEDRAIAGWIDRGRTHAVINKMDRVGYNGAGEWVNDYSPCGNHKVSALTGWGVGDLVEALSRGLLHHPEDESVALTSDRQARGIDEALSAVIRSRDVLCAGGALELVAADLHRASSFLAEITGEAAGPELLDAIFRRFCIGK
jgi:tRNA modification GTPase